MKEKPKEEEEVNDQTNKHHKKIRHKLKKKRENEKKVKKQKKEKKKEKDREKEGAKKHTKKKSAGKKDDKGIKLSKLKKNLKKFLKVFDEDNMQLFEIFGTLDRGGEIDTSEIENKKIKKYLEKIFKSLLLKKNQSGEYCKDPATEQINLRKYIETIVNDAIIMGYSSSSEDLESEAESIEEEPAAGEKKQEANKKKKQLEKPSEKILQALQPKPSSKSSLEDERFKQLINPKGVAVLSEKEKKQILNAEQVKSAFLKSSLPTPEGQAASEKTAGGWMNDKEVKKILDGTFSKLDQSNPSLRNFLDKRERPNQVQETPEQKQQSDEQDEIRAFMQEYDRKNRPKSLLEEHQEKLKQKTPAPRSNERRPFDRDRDLKITKFDSKKIFGLINSGDNSLGNRFKNSKIEKNFN